MILDLIENIVMLPIIIAVCYMVVLVIVETGKGLTTVKALKMFSCVMLSTAIAVSILIIIVLDVYQMAVVWKEYEVDTVLDPRVKSMSFIAIELIWNIIGVVLIFNIWKHIYYTNNNIINKVKESIKKLKEGKNYGRYENTN